MPAEGGGEIGPRESEAPAWPADEAAALKAAEAEWDLVIRLERLAADLQVAEAEVRELVLEAWRRLRESPQPYCNEALAEALSALIERLQPKMPES